MDLDKLKSIGQIADDLGVNYQRVYYVLRGAPDIRESAQVGRTRLFDVASVKQIRELVGTGD